MSKSAAKGALLKIKDTTYKSILGLGDFNFAPFEVDIIDVTSHDSANNFEEKIPGIKKPARISIPITWDDSDAVHQLLVTNNGTAQDFEYTGTGKPSAYKFTAIIGLVFENPVKGAKRATLDLTISTGTQPA